MNITQKSEFPRPDFIRDNYISLNGEWDFDFDDSREIYNSQQTGKGINLSKKIKVPFPFQSPESGIDTREQHTYVCYKKAFNLTSENANKTVLLHFGAVDHDAEVWVNGTNVGSHSGGYTPFYFNISKLVHYGENELVVYITDDYRIDQVRGKQFWETDIKTGCHYDPVTGIWQEVWLEFTDSAYITDVHYITDFDQNSVKAVITFNDYVTGDITLDVTLDNEPMAYIKQRVMNKKQAFCTVSFGDYGFQDNRKILWSPAKPNLFDTTVTLETENTKDTVDTYFGIRKVETIDDKVYFNNSQLYSRMILDQGYWKDGIYRPKTDDGFRQDVQWILDLGFNAARKHQKIEDPKFYYWADRLGILVWGELPSFYGFTDYACIDAENTMREFILRDRNHPSIIAWVPFNETWGLRKIVGDRREADFARELYYMCKRMDPERLVSTNDGWENVYPTDIASVHDYRQIDKNISEYYTNTDFFKTGSGRTGHAYLLPGEKYGGEPIMITEFGGKRVQGGNGWGYEATIENVEQYVADIENDINNILNTPTFCGYCYTQLTDVYQETNGLLDMDRKPKADVEKLYAIFSRKGRCYKELN